MTICCCFSLQETVYDKDQACVHTIPGSKNKIKILPVTTTVLEFESMKSMLQRVESCCLSVPNSIIIQVSVANFIWGTFFLPAVMSLASHDRDDL